MNGPEQPLSADTLDELLSADIDGELDRAATELGFTTAEARAALDASPNAAERRRALLQARDLLAARPALTPDTEARLVAGALARAADERQQAAPPVAQLPRRRFQNSRRALAGVGTAAAVIAGVIALSAQNQGQNAMSSSAPLSSGSVKQAGESPAFDSGAQPPHASYSFGEVSPAGSLQTKVRQRLALPELSGSATGTTAASASPSVRVPANGDTTYDAKANTFAERCAAAIQSTAASRAPVLSGSGTDKGRPVFITVFRRAGSYDVYVLLAADCSVVSRSTIP